MINISLPRHWLARLCLISVLVLSCSLLQGEQPAFANPLRFGNEGASVEQLQTQLRSLGYLDSDVNGVYDEPTRQAIRTFQTELGLPADGIAGDETQQQLAQKVAGGPRASAPPDIQRILDRGKLVVALLGTDNSPFFMAEANSNDPVGLDIKIAHGLADALGVDLEFNRSAETFNEVVDKVYELEADIAISKLSRTLSRAQRVRFSHPYVTMRQGLLVNRLQIAEQSEGNQVIEAIRNFNGDVGVIQGSSYGSFIKQKFPNATIREYPTWDDIVEAVVKGDIQAAYRDELEVKKVVLKNPDAALRLQTIALTDTKDQIAMALPWDSQSLQALVNQYLDTFGLDYTADDVLAEYADYLQE